MVFPFTEAAMLVEGGRGAEHLPTVLALDLCAAVSVHTFVAAQVRELGVRLVAYLTCTDKETDIERISMQHTHIHTHTHTHTNKITSHDMTSLVNMLNWKRKYSMNDIPLFPSIL